MAVARWNRLCALGVGFSLGCGGDGGGGTGPCTPGPATQIVKSSGDGQSWYVNNPLPVPLGVTARDANACPVPGVLVDWTIQTGGGGLSVAQSTTNSSGVASTVDSVGSASSQMVRATAAGLPTQEFTATAGAPPTSAAVTVSNNSFSPNAVAMQTGSTVTWTWNSGGVTHDVAYDSGPTPLPASSAPQGSGTHSNTITTVGRYTYHCNFHGGMTGSVTVVH